MKNILFSSLAILIGGIFFALNDAIINFLSVKDILFYHFIFYGTPIFLIPIIYLKINGKWDSKMKSQNIYIPLFRGVILTPLPFFVFVSLKNISLPEFTSLSMTAPIFGIFLSFFFLNEKMNKNIIFSLIMGIIGVLFVIKPGFSTFNYYYLLVLLGAFFVSTAGFIVNKYNDNISSVGYFIYGGIFIHLLSIIFFIMNPLKFNLSIFLYCIISAVFVNSAIFLNTYSFQKSQKFFGSINTLIYFQILWSVLLGYYFFNEYLNFYSLLGVIFIVISGLLSIPAQFKQLNES